MGEPAQHPFSRLLVDAGTLLFPPSRATIAVLGGAGTSDELALKALAAGTRPADIKPDTYDKHGLLREVFALLPAGKPRKLVWITAATEHADQAAGERERFFALPQLREAFRLGDVKCFGFEDPRQGKEATQAIAAADFILFGGGDQERLTKRLPPDAFRALRQRAARGAVVVGGSSAGAAAMSLHMLTSDEGKGDYVVPGFGITPRVMFDTHFRNRGRLDRLRKAVAERPGCIGVGVDECTLLVLDGGKASVKGQGGVTVVDQGQGRVYSAGEMFLLSPDLAALTVLHDALGQLRPGKTRIPAVAEAGPKK